MKPTLLNALWTFQDHYSNAQNKRLYEQLGEDHKQLQQEFRIYSKLFIVPGKQQV
jgi:hypothetical protein